MSDWIIDNGLLLLKLKDGEKYVPSALDLYEQIKEDKFVHAGEVYAPLASLGLRFSGITVHVIAKFFFAENVTLSLFGIKNQKKYPIAVNFNKFSDYIICNGVWHYLDPLVGRINEILIQNKINPKSIPYNLYILLNREFKNNKIDVTRDVLEGNREKGIVSNYPLIPMGLKATLYTYQKEGSKWLDFMIRQKCGCILADEMGLGKTLQIITVMGLLKERKKKSHILVVCPISLLENWKREIIKFYPTLTVNIHYGRTRTGDYNQLYEYDVNIMPYSCAITDSGLLSMTQWDLLVVDEAQNIKNPYAKRTKAIKRIACDVPIAVTGTPFENHMTDIWSIVDFVVPGFLGSLSQFEVNYQDDVESANNLEEIITPILLRRKVLDVARDLPERVDIPMPIAMSEEEAILYESNRQVEEKAYLDLKSMQLSTIQKLRTFCTHPYVYDQGYQNIDPASISTKYNRLCELLEEIFLLGDKVVVFTSFKNMIKLLVSDVKKRFNVYADFIDGSVEAFKRQNIIDAFEKVDGPGVLILNPKAAGAGLNITCANHVVHYNLEWNPAIEDQASARVYRRGQDKTVFVYRLFYVDTIEEIINDKIKAKRLLSDSAIVGNSGQITEKEYLIKALSVSPYKNN